MKRIQLEIRPYRFSKATCIYVAGMTEEAVNRLEEHYKPERVLYQLGNGLRKWVVRPKTSIKHKNITRKKK